MIQAPEKLTPQWASNVLDLDRDVEEALHRLMPRHERVLRVRFKLCDPKHAPTVRSAKPAELYAALRALRRLAVSTVSAR